MTSVASIAHVPYAARTASPSTHIRITLLGLGQVGSAVATLAREPIDDAPAFVISSALVRDVQRPRSVDTRGIPLTIDVCAALDEPADVVVELLGGLEPARTLVLAALERGTPVVTANKSLLAVHGDELFAAAERTGMPLFYEASVLAGVPFLGTSGRRPRVRDVAAVQGIVNGTSNFILSRMSADRVAFDRALADAQRAGYAEPDPSKDVNGDDAVEKLCVLLRHFAGLSVEPRGVETIGLDGIELADLQQAATFGGVLRPIVMADWDSARVTAYAGPALVAAAHPLSRIDGVQNGICLRSRWSGDLCFSGPGAGPSVTAATVLDDVVEAHAGARALRLGARRSECAAPDTGWFVRLSSDGFADDQHAPSILATLGIRMRRTSPLVAHQGRRRQWLQTSHCGRPHLEAALAVLASRTTCDAWTIRSLE